MVEKMIKIRKATTKDIDIINSIYRNVITDLNQKKIDMLWSDIYPFCEIEHDIKDNNMYIVKSNNLQVGSFVLTNFDDPEYNEIKWNHKDNFVYLNRLVVDPQFQGQGIAKETLKLIEKNLKQTSCKTIRLTVYEHNYPAIKLYESFEFEKINKGYWQLENKKFIGYEKRIS